MTRCNPVRFAERDLVAELLRSAPTLSRARIYATGCEVRSHGRARTDVVLKLRNEIWGIEVKLSDWRKAIAQAVLNQPCFDRSFIALQDGKVSEAVANEAEYWGVGVIVISAGKSRVVVPASRGRPESVLKRRIIAEIGTST